MPSSSRLAGAAAHSAPSSSSPVREEGGGDDAGGAESGAAPRTYQAPDPSSTEPSGFRPYVLRVGPALFGYNARVAACASRQSAAPPQFVSRRLL